MLMIGKIVVKITKKGLLNKWRKEISRFENDIEDRIKELEKRGINHERR